MDKINSNKIGHLISAMFLVAGCCIGGGMLALPVASGAGGFVPSLVMMAICWMGMTLSALLLLEVCLWMKEEAHVISMTSKILGPIGKGVAWVLFLYISYASVVAYAAGGGVQIAEGLNRLFDFQLSNDAGAVILTVVFTGIVLFGGQFVGRINSVLFISLIVAYFLMIGLSLDEVKAIYLKHRNWKMSYLTVPLFLTAFSFQTMVPSLTPILKRHTGMLRLSVIGGTTIAFVIYAIWQAMILGIVPAEGPDGLIEANRLSVPATQFIHKHVSGTWIVVVAEYFGFFAIATSFLAMGLGLFDFLSDGLKIPKKRWGALLLGVIIAVPTIVFATQFERAFMIAMETSGGYGDTILNGMIPVLMVWIGRYHMGYENHFKVPGGRVLLIAVFLFFAASFCLELLMQTGIVVSDNVPFEVLELHNPEQIYD